MARRAPVTIRWRSIGTYALVLAAICAGPTALAAQFAVVTLRQTDQVGIAMSGILDGGDEAKFHDLAAKLSDPIVILSGPGGRVSAALDIGEQIRRRGLTTLVPPNTDCASACSMIWLAGRRRLLGDGARIGFHAMSLAQSNGGYTETHEIDYVLRSYLTGLGLSLDATATIVNTPSALVRWLDALELNANGIATDPYP